MDRFAVNTIGAVFYIPSDMLKILLYNYTIADSMFTAIFNQVIIIEDLNLQTFFHTLDFSISVHKVCDKLFCTASAFAAVIHFPSDRFFLDFISHRNPLTL